MADLPDAAGPGITVAATVLTDARGRVLLVRKRGTASFLLPGGKLEPGEGPDAAAVREVAEELGLVLERDRLIPLGSFLTDAANEPGHWLRSHVFVYPDAVSGERADAEIEEARWVDPHRPDDSWAPLTHRVLGDSWPPSGDARWGERTP